VFGHSRQHKVQQSTVPFTLHTFLLALHFNIAGVLSGKCLYRVAIPLSCVQLSAFGTTFEVSKMCYPEKVGVYTLVHTS